MSFITPAYAQAAATGGSSFSTMIVPLVLIFVIMYFLIIRPQRAQMKKHQEMINAVRRGDNVITGGGFVGKVTKVFDDTGEIEVELAENVRVRVIRSTLSSVRVKGEVTAEKSTSTSVKKNNTKARANKQEKTTKNNTDTEQNDEVKSADVSLEQDDKNKS